MVLVRREACVFPDILRHFHVVSRCVTFNVRSFTVVSRLLSVLTRSATFGHGSNGKTRCTVFGKYIKVELDIGEFHLSVINQSALPPRKRTPPPRCDLKYSMYARSKHKNTFFISIHDVITSMSQDTTILGHSRASRLSFHVSFIEHLDRM